MTPADELKNRSEIELHYTAWRLNLANSLFFRFNDDSALQLLLVTDVQCSSG